MTGNAQARHWLSVQCRTIDTTAKGVVFLGEPDSGNYPVAAAWPEDYSGTPMIASAAKAALGRRQVVFAAAKGDNEARAREIAAAPLLHEGRIHGVVALDVPRRTNGQRDAIARMLQVDSAWLEQIRATGDSPRTRRLALVLDLVATCLGAQSFNAAATATVSELATRLGCDRVSLGLAHAGHVKLIAVSHTAALSQRPQLVRQLQAAMDEALEHESTVQYPPARATDPRAQLAHAELARRQKSDAVCTVPLHDRQTLLGALVFERGAQRPPLDAEAVTLYEQIAALIGPVLELRRREDRRLRAVIADAGRKELARLFGPQHLVAKLVIGGAVLLLAILAIMPGRYQVAADALLEGRVERVVAAPQKGFIQTVSARPGDVVAQGAVLATLDDRDLKLEQLKWSAKQEQISQEYRRALAERDRTQIGVLRAQLDQAQAQLALIEKQLARAQLVAPFEAVVVSGDFSQALGAPVERGQVLFKLAPLEGYRVILRVDESDIADVREGQRGRLTLTAAPDEALPIAIERITPVAVADAGANYFRIEAKLDNPPAYLRPGMQGVGKIDIGTRRILYIWTRSLINWMRLKVWSWLP